jgi:trk system potassium uptake protein TrkH
MGIRVASIYRIAGFLCMVFSPVLILPIAVSLWYQDGEADYFISSLLIQFFVGLLLWFPLRRRKMEMRRREGFIVVVLFWVLLSLLGASTLYFGQHLSFIDALFEAVSGLTTTGATVLSDIDRMPPSILFYRQELQWFGGMGLIVLAVAVMPVLGIGGMLLYRAETPGPMKEEKLTPRLAQSAKVLWTLYAGLTLVCALAFWLTGMTPFDAISHSLATVSTGGFSTHDASLGYYHSVGIEAIAAFFMLLGGINFSIHYLAWHGKSLRHYIQNHEVRTFLLFLLVLVILVALALKISGRYDDVTSALRVASFEVISVVTSTGYGIADFSTWPIFLPALMIFISFIGGCGGSTAGGMKVIRIMGLFKLGYREIRRLVHPKGVFTVRFSGSVMSQNTIQAIWGFFSVYVVTFVILMLLLMVVSGQDEVTSFSAVATCLNNLGPGLGTVAQTFTNINDGGKVISIVAMLLGRLEVFTILVLLHPDFWRT